MREIKFRAYAPNAEGEKTLYFTLDDFINGKLNLWWFTKYKPTIDRYTGRKDKNGKEIYEGDIVKYDLKAKNNQISLYQIFYYDSSFCLKKIKDIKDSTDLHKDWLDAHSINEFEIIGNIMENPELLK